MVDIGPMVLQRGWRVKGTCTSQKPAELLGKPERRSKSAIHWFEENYTNLHTGKCHILIFGHKYEHQWAQIGKYIVWKENKIELLRKTIDNILIFDSHVLNICSKANKQLSALCKLKHISAVKDTL